MKPTCADLEDSGHFELVDEIHTDASRSIAVVARGRNPRR